MYTYKGMHIDECMWVLPSVAEGKVSSWAVMVNVIIPICCFDFIY